MAFMSGADASAMTRISVSFRTRCIAMAGSRLLSFTNDNDRTHSQSNNIIDLATLVSYYLQLFGCSLPYETTGNG